MAEETPGFWSGESEIERVINAGLHGAPEVGAEERKHFLGELRERVLASATRAEVRGPLIISEVAAAVKDPRATAVIIDAEIPFADAAKYSSLAGEHHLAFTMRGDPAFEGDIGLVVVSAR